MTLLKSQQLRLATVVALFVCYGGILNAKSFTITGKIVDDDGDPVGKANVDVLLDGESQLKKPAQTNKKKGTFSVKIKDFEPGDYTVSVEHSDKGTGSLMISLDEGKKKDLGEIPISNAPKEVVAEGNPGESTQQSKAPKSMPTSIPSLEPSLPRAPEATGVPSKHFIVNELSFEIKRLSAEFKHLNQELDDLKALSKMWVNPLTMYSKEIILKNGSTVFGKIVYQDDKSLKVETLVGYLIVDRSQVVRIVDNVISEDRQEYVPEQIRESYTPPPMPKLAQPKYTSTNSSARNSSAKFSANCVLVGNISEKKDNQGNVIFQGEVKNIGGRRADFVKVDFVFRKNWSGETKTLTTFAKGSYNTFESGIVSDASLLPGAMGQFELYVPQDFGAFIGYSYVIDWEEYQ